MSNRDVNFIIRARNDAETAFKNLLASLNELDAAQTDLSNSSVTTNGSLKKQEQALKDAAKATTKAQNDIATSMERTKKKVADSKVAMDGWKAALTDLGPKMSAAAAKVEKLQAALKDDPKNAALKKTLREAETAARGLAKEEKRLTDSFKTASATIQASVAPLEKMGEQLTRAKTETARLGTETDRYKGKLESLAKAERESIQRRKEMRAASAGFRQFDASAGRVVADNRIERAIASKREQVRAEKEHAAAIAETAAKQSQLAAAAAKLGNATKQAGISNLTRQYRENMPWSARVRAGLRAMVADIGKVPGAAQSAAAGLRSTTAAANGLTAATRRLKNTGLRGIFSEFYGDSRRALSFTQRLRGEFLSITASALGFYAIFSQGAQVYQAQRALDAATNRLGATFEQNTASVAREIAFLRGEADELGFSFEALSDDYSKFLASATATNFTVLETRTIFTQVTEAARVMNLSTEQVGGVLTALTQIAGKGTLQMEELRQQLGDRFPGAVAIMARALGYAETQDGMAQFFKDVTAGAIDARSALTAFGGEIENMTAGQLEEALDTVTASVGRFQNSIFNARNQIAEGGFTDGLQSGLDALNEWFKSPEAEDFFLRVGASIGGVLEMLPGLLDHLYLIREIFVAVVAIKMFQTFRGLTASIAQFMPNAAEATRLTRQYTVEIGRMGVASTRTGRMMRAMGFSIGASARVAARATVVMRGLTGAMAALGGPWGILIQIASFFVGRAMLDGATQAEDMTTALYRQREAVDVIRRAYTDAAGDMDVFRTSMEDMDMFEIERGLRQMAGALEDVRAKARAFADERTRVNRRGQRVSTGESEANNLLEFAATAGATDEAEQFNATFAAFAAGEADVAAVTGAFNRLNEAVKAAEGDLELPDEFLASLGAAVRVARDASEQIEILEAAIADQAGTATDAQRVLLLGTDATQDLTAATEDATDASEDFAKASDDLKDGIRGILGEFPALEGYLDALEEQEAFDSLIADTVEAAAKVINLNQFWDDLDEAIGETSWSGVFTGLLTDMDGVIAKMQSILGAVTSLLGRVREFGGIVSEGSGGLLGLATGLAAGEPLSGDGLARSGELIRRSEGFRNNPYNDPRTDGDGNQIGENIWRAGYGSDTFMRDGRTQTVQQDSVVTRAEADADLNRRLGEFQRVIIGQVGAERFQGMNANQQAALTSIAYNYGNIPARVARVINSGGTDQEIAAAIVSLQNDNGGVNSGRRSEEAGIFLTPTDEGGGGGLSDQDDITNATITANERELRQQDMIARGLERQVEIENAVAEARRENPFISEQQVAQIEAQTGALYDQAQAAEAASEAADLAEEQGEFRSGISAEAEQAAFEAAIADESLVDRMTALEIREAELEAQRLGVELTQAERDAIAERVQLQYAERSEEERRAAIQADATELADRITQLEERKALLRDQLAAARADGDSALVAETEGELSDVNDQLLIAIENAKAFWAAIGGEEAENAILGLEATERQLQEAGRTAKITAEEINDLIANKIGGALTTLAEAVANGEESWIAIRDTILQATGEILIEVGKMIVQRALLNALSGGAGDPSGGIGGTVAGFFNSFVSHKGGMAGDGRSVRKVHPAVFANARRMHGGGMPGIKNDEYATILQKNEEVLTDSNPRHIFNQGGGGKKEGVKFTVVNQMDSGEMVERAVKSGRGGDALINFMTDNAETLRGIVGA